MQDITAIISIMDNVSAKITLEFVNITLTNSKLMLNGLNVIMNQAKLGDITVDKGKDKTPSHSVNVAESSFNHLQTKTGYHIDVTNCTIQEYNRTWMEVEDSELNISNSIFYDIDTCLMKISRSGVYMVYSQIYFLPLDSETNEEVTPWWIMDLTASNLTIKDSTFVYSRKTKGPSILKAIQSQVAIDNSTFMNFTSGDSLLKAYNESILTVSNSSFNGNRGSVLSIVMDSLAVIVESVFIGNVGIYGASIVAAGLSTIEIARSSLINNIASRGGAIYVQDHVALHCHRNNFTGNKAMEFSEIENKVVGEGHIGGAIAAVNSSDVTVIDSRFYDNFAENSGGAIALEDNVTLTVANALFVNNSARNYGGALVALRRGRQVRLNPELTSEKILRYNPADYLTNYSRRNRPSDVTVMEAMDELRENSKSKDHTVQLSSRGIGAIVVNSSFIHNIAGHSGGAVSVQLNHNLPLQVNHSIFESNNSPVGGSVLDLHNVTDIVLQSSMFKNNGENSSQVVHIARGRSVRVARVDFGKGSQCKMAFSDGEYSLRTFVSTFNDEKYNISLRSNENNFRRKAVNKGILKFAACNASVLETPYASSE